MAHDLHVLISRKRGQAHLALGRGGSGRDLQKEFHHVRNSSQSATLEQGTTTQRARLGIDGLETRDVPSAAALMGGTLVVKGTDAGESISVQVNDPRFAGPTNSLVVYSDGAVIGKFAVTSVNRIEVHAGGGNDKITISDQIKLPSILDGGAGDDSLLAGSGSTVLSGRRRQRSADRRTEPRRVDRRRWCRFA